MKTSPWHLASSSLCEPVRGSDLHLPLLGAVTSSLDYLTNSESSRTSSLGPGKLRPLSRRERRTGGALPTLRVEKASSLTLLRAKHWNATLAALKISGGRATPAGPQQDDEALCHASSYSG